jgi:hypothetical protein
LPLFYSGGIVRARNIKPGFFENEELAELSFECRLLYIGLWCYADREGRFEWRPKRIKALIFPYDLKINIEKMLNVMTCKGHVMTYNCNGKKYGFIPTFKNHNNPHPHEAKSKCPDPKEFIKQIDNNNVIKCNDMSMECNADIRNEDIMNPDIRNEDIKENHIDYDSIKNQWNSIATDPVKKINDITNKRKKKIKIRFKEHTDFNNIFSQCIGKIKDNDFFYGKNNKKWIISFDWLIYDDTNYIKVWEGKYDNKIETEEDRTKRILDEEAERFYRKHPEKAKEDGYEL